MSLLNINEGGINSVPARYIPKITIVYVLICAGLFAQINRAPNPNSWEVLEMCGGTSANAVWSGHWWGLLVNNFIHIELWHILFNLYWLTMLGKKIEYEQGPWFFLFLTLTAGLVSSCVQLAWYGSMGIGFSGIGYALFGYLLIRDRYDERYTGFLPRSTKALFIVWFFFCISTTTFKLWEVANGGHAGGLLWGMLMGYMPRINKYVRVPVAAAAFAICMIPGFWAPWQLSWLETRAYQLDMSGQKDKASEAYDAVLKKDPLNLFASNNKKIIVSEKINKLNDKANDALSNHQFEKSLVYYDSILQLDSNSVIAISQKAAVENYLNAKKHGDSILHQY